MEQGISIEEACETNSIGTEKDFELNCNEDGTVKQQYVTTTVSLKDSDSSVTVNSTQLYIMGTLVIIVAVLVIGLLIRKITKRKTN